MPDRRDHVLPSYQPYQRLAVSLLEAVSESGVLAEGAMVVVEHGKRHALPVVAGLVVLDARRYGDTVITRLTAAEAGE